MRFRALAGLLPLLLAMGRPLHARPCELSGADREWIAAAIEIWGKAADALERSIDSMPWTVLYDEHCVVHLNPRSGRSRVEDGALAVTFGGKPVPIRSIAFRKRFSIPSGAKLGADAVAFTSMARDDGTFFVMALPSVWRKDPRSMPGEDIDEFASGVLAHEMTHTIHLSSVMAALAEVKGRHPSMPESVDDDYLQSVFEADADYVAAYEREMALYRRAVAEADATVAREAARQALAASDQRRQHYFRGDRAFFADLEALFLNMEGVASWVAYSVVGRGGDPMAFSGRFWSQQEGLLLFLLLDRFDPGWKARVFAADVPDPFAMLRAAICRVSDIDRGHHSDRQTAWYLRSEPS